MNTLDTYGAYTKRFKLIMEFDGSRYSGWQQQKDARTIQGSLLKAASDLFGAPVDAQGSGRTDAGVHGLRFAAHLEVSTDLSPAAIRQKMNALLPADIAILECRRAGSHFHARYNCIGRSYCY
jgi:tRNA pseudouridine38-40 synthase